MCTLYYEVQCTTKTAKKKKLEPSGGDTFSCMHIYMYIYYIQYILFLGGTSASTQSSYNRKYLQLSELGQCTHLMLFQDLATVLCADTASQFAHLGAKCCYNKALPLVLGSVCIHRCFHLQISSVFSKHQQFSACISDSLLKGCF